MLDLGWSEMAIIAVVALFVIGPKDLPKALRTLGHYGGKVRGLAREFRSSIDEVVREAELDEVKNQIQSVTNMDLDTALDATERLADNSQSPDSESTDSEGEAQSKAVSGSDGAPVNKHFARFGEHYTRTSNSPSVDESTGSLSAEGTGQTPSVDPPPNLPTVVAQVVEARERNQARVQVEAEEAKETEAAVPERQAES